MSFKKVNVLRADVMDKRMRELELTRDETAEGLGLSQPYVSQIANGDRDPSLSTFVKICEILHLPPADLLRIKLRSLVKKEKK